MVDTILKKRIGKREENGYVAAKRRFFVRGSDARNVPNGS